MKTYNNKRTNTTLTSMIKPGPPICRGFFSSQTTTHSITRDLQSPTVFRLRPRFPAISTSVKFLLLLRKEFVLAGTEGEGVTHIGKFMKSEWLNLNLTIAYLNMLRRKRNPWKEMLVLAKILPLLIDFVFLHRGWLHLNTNRSSDLDAWHGFSSMVPEQSQGKVWRRTPFANRYWRAASSFGTAATSWNKGPESESGILDSLSLFHLVYIRDHSDPYS